MNLNQSRLNVLTQKDLTDGIKISDLFSTLSEENKTMAMVYILALRDKELATNSRGKKN